MKAANLALFDSERGLDRGRDKGVEVVWYLLKCLFFLSPLPWPSSWKVKILRSFGAKVGDGVVIKPRVNIHFPWKLIVGDHVWLGEELFILNFEPITIGSNSCLSQRAFLCAGNHDFRDEAFSYRNAPITISEGVWVGAQCFVGPGVTVGAETVLTAGSIVTKDIPENRIFGGNPAIELGVRWKEAGRPQ
ncbi:WcaF family extracellular polysaccharide biosynthesis acetyltransferase [Roseibacillus ishigakijimensis]|uniref:Colanic acid biosynthesis acetyltransferase WcaF n=1 Tax=Roseibacillus ishigakijimensis TaxID=454146 RepID=A0A934VM69_9BACT|nr:WcaF family extracellular polysaccharide biosynthesis acetyltransferase [Roseibacillus ishigakijimensis]MBK1833645.1 colanic acid biosynthesis acetyltransferase WcaF [Roseibacillus ishigakijimensis]